VTGDNLIGLWLDYTCRPYFRVQTDRRIARGQSEVSIERWSTVFAVRLMNVFVADVHRRRIRLDRKKHPPVPNRHTVQILIYLLNPDEKNDPNHWSVQRHYSFVV